MLRPVTLLLVAALALLGSADAKLQFSDTKDEKSFLDLNAKREQNVWMLRSSNTTENGDLGFLLPATVPGGVYSDLEANGNFTTDIYESYNDRETRWVAWTNWTYERTFDVTPEQAQKAKKMLVLEGVDTIASVWFKGVGAYVQLKNQYNQDMTKNMFAKYTFDLTDHIQIQGTYFLKIEFISPLNYTTNAWEQASRKINPEGLPAEYQGEPHANYIRKMQASYSWDWGPAYPSVGIWKDAYIQFYNDAVIRDVMVKTTTGCPSFGMPTCWHLDTKVYIDELMNIAPEDLCATVSLAEKNKKTTAKPFEVNGASLVLDPLTFSDTDVNEAVQKWMPNGYGDQPLYTVVVALQRCAAPTVNIHEAELQVGFREIRLNQDFIDKSDELLGRKYEVIVNDIPIYSKGSNIAPIHVLPEKVTDETIEWLFKSAQTAHMNMFRIWGGGIYQSDAFYDAADRHGILIWQDFMFACAMYPADDDFLTTVQQEVTTQLRRLQHHASLAVWSANNENEAALMGNWYDTDSQFFRYENEYKKLYVETIIKTIEAEDFANRECMSSAPSNGVKTKEEGYISLRPYDLLYGDIHFFEYDHDTWDYRSFRKARYVSEFGYQSWPSLETLAASTQPNDWSWNSAMMDYRQHHPGGQTEIPYLISYNLPLPEAFDTPAKFSHMLRLNWIQQAMGIKTQAESYRRLRDQINEIGEGHNMGALYWQLNDVWPGASWSSIEWNGKWKLLHYYACNFFAPVLTSLFKTYDGATGEESGISVRIVSDKLERVEGVLTASLYGNNKLEPLATTTLDINIPNLDSTEDLVLWSQTDLDTVCTPDLRPCFITTKLLNNGISIDGAPDNFIFVQYPKDGAAIQDPGLQMQVTKVADTKDKFMIRLNATNDVPALFVNLNMRNLTLDGTFSDNGFLMTSRIHDVFVTIRSCPSDGTTAECKLDEVSNAVEVWSLFDLVDAPVPTQPSTVSTSTMPPRSTTDGANSLTLTSFVAIVCCVASFLIL